MAKTLVMSWAATVFQTMCHLDCCYNMTVSFHSCSETIEVGASWPFETDLGTEILRAYHVSIFRI